MEKKNWNSWSMDSRKAKGVAVKRFLGIALCLTLSLGLLSGCGKGDSKETGNATMGRYVEQQVATVENADQAMGLCLVITEDVADMFRAIIEDRVPPKTEKVIDGYTGFLFYDDDGNPLVAMHWQHRFNHMIGRYNDIYRVQMPNITPHVCRHTYCSNMAKSGMNPKTLQYLMGHSDISVTMNVYTHIGFDDAEEELRRMEEFRKAQDEVEKKNDAKAVSQKMFKVV